MPMPATPTPTSRHSSSDVQVYSGNTVCSIWVRMERASLSNSSQDSTTAITGNVSRKTSNTKKAEGRKRKKIGRSMKTRKKAVAGGSPALPACAVVYAASYCK